MLISYYSHHTIKTLHSSLNSVACAVTRNVNNRTCDPGTGRHRQRARRRLREHFRPLHHKWCAQERGQVFRPYHKDLRMRNHVARDPRGDDGNAEIHPAHGRGPVRAQGGPEIPAGGGPGLLRIRE